jgi:drug/metabolite transporter (DMT)-like permease
MQAALNNAALSPAKTSAPLSRGAAYAVLAGLVLIWGANWPIMKLVVQAMPPLWFVATRLAIGALCLFALLVATGQLARPTRADWPVIWSVSIFQMWLFMALTTIGVQFIPAGRSAIIAYTSPLWVLPAAVWLFGERLTPWKLLGMILGLGGLIVLLNPASIDWSDEETLVGNFLLVVGAAMWAIAILHTRRHRWHLSPLQLAPFQMALLIVPGCAAAWALEGPFRAEWSWQLIAMLVYNGPLATAFGFWAAVSIQRALPSTTVSLSFLAIPAWGLIASTLWLGEALPISLVLGGVLILLGVAAIALADARRR